jgi:hypothetical protein
MSDISVHPQKPGFGVSLRNDKWWMEPAVVVFGFTAFIVYSTWAAFQAGFYWYSAGITEGFGGYLSPMYSPILFIQEGCAGCAPAAHSWLGSWPAWWPAFLPASPAFLILPFPGLFRFTCYYYRKAYYRAFAGTPPGCAVGAISQKDYKGETGLLIFQNFHRYALYPAIALVFILSYDAFMSFFRGGEFGIGVGSIILTINPILLGSYTFGCHSFRHLMGGKLDCYSCGMSSNIRHKGWLKVSWLNNRHMLFAWLSLVWVGFTDVYVRLVSMGIWTDFSTWNM